MKQLRAWGRYFTVGEWLLWGISSVVILVSFCLFDRESYITLAASLIGVTSLIFAAKGNPVSQVLMVLWVMAALSEVRYISVVVCFMAFLVNDLYGFLSWRKMGKRQGIA